MTHVLRNETVDFKRDKGTVALIYDKDHKLLFDKIIEVGRSKLLGVDIVPHKENLHIHIRSYKELHEQLGHPNDAVLKATAKKFNLKYDTTHLCHVKIVLVLRLRLRTFQRKLQRF
jgi:predicted nucleic acid-binding protein